MNARLLASLAAVSLLALQVPAAGAQAKTTEPKGVKPAARLRLRRPKRPRRPSRSTA